MPIIVLLTAVVTSALLSAAARTLSLRCGVLDEPCTRSSHSSPTPRLGGTAIVTAWFAAWLLAAAFGVAGAEAVSLIPLVLGALLVAAVGLIDDIWHLSPPLKLLGQLVAVTPVVPLLPTDFGGWPSSLVLAAAILWIVGYTNIFNFMDGSDGLAAGIAVVSGVSFGIIALMAGQNGIAWTALVTAAAALGFLRHNHAPASIFMGDSGSLFFGYVFAVIAVLLVDAGVSGVAVGLVLTPFLFDGCVTLLRRLTRAEPIWRAHRSHLYQRWLAVGKSHRQVAYVYWAWGCASGALAVSYAAGANRFVVLSTAAAWTLTIVVLVWTSERRWRQALLMTH